MTLALTCQAQALPQWQGIQELNPKGLHESYLQPLGILTWCLCFPEEVDCLDVQNQDGHLFSPFLDRCFYQLRELSLMYTIEERVEIVNPSSEDYVGIGRVENYQAQTVLRMQAQFALHSFKKYVWSNSSVAKQAGELDHDLRLHPLDQEVDWFLLFIELLAVVAWSYAVQLRVMGVVGPSVLSPVHVFSVTNIADLLAEDLKDLKAIKNTDELGFPDGLTEMVRKHFHAIQFLYKSYLPYWGINPPMAETSVLNRADFHQENYITRRLIARPSPATTARKEVVRRVERYGRFKRWLKAWVLG